MPKPARCEVCHAAGPLYRYGSYRRRLIGLAQVYLLPIQRIFCTACRHSFALIPFFVLKYHRYAAEVITTALRWLKSHTFEKVAEVLTNRYVERLGRNLAPLTLYFWRRKFD